MFCNINNLSFFAEDADNFIQAYRDVCKCFVKTGLLKKCQSSLKKYGITILSGQQGCGKTLSAVYIMSKNRHYKKWTKLKFSSWVDLLTLELEANTLIYIDNLFDSYIYMYPEELRKWWCSLCYFYFEKIQGKKEIHLLITAKDDVINEACEQIKTDIGKCPFYLKAGNVPLTAEERKQILESQFKLAEKLKGITKPAISTYADIQNKDTISAIGFPLCAHLYAFETDKIYKTKDIFTDPVSYVIRHFKREIDNDNSNSVKTLFMFLLLYTSPGSFKPSIGLDLKYGEEIRDYLENAKVAPENLVNEMEPLNFENLHTTAESLINTILVKPSTMFEFKHQIYLEGVSDYFFRHPQYSKVAVKHFPLDILRPYEFPGALENILQDITQRFKKEIFKGMQAVLSCKIFGKSEFESKFCDELNRDNMLQKLLFNPNEILEKELPFTFWTSKYHLKILSESALAAVRVMNQRSDYLFYQARLGECCKTDKRYFANSTNSTTGPGNAEQLVWNFKTPKGGSILHVILSSDMPDYEANTILLRLLNDAATRNNLMDTNLLKCAMEQVLYSRITCMLSILQNEKVESEKISISCILGKINSCKKYNARLELEFLVRICILLVYGSMRKTCAKLPSVNPKFLLVEELLHEKHSQHKMSAIIQRCIEKCKKSETRDSIDIKCTTCKRKVSPEFEKAIKDAVQVQTGKDNLLTS